MLLDEVCVNVVMPWPRGRVVDRDGGTRPPETRNRAADDRPTCFRRVGRRRRRRVGGIDR